MKENMQIVFGLLGGLAVFIYGMNLMSESLQKAAGEKMKTILALLTKNRIMGVIAGTLVTAVLQSSSATTVMAIGFVSAGLMNLPQAISIIFGANIGTTMTAQIIAFKITDYIYAFIFVGFLLTFVCKSERIKSIGQTIFAFGLLFLGIETMGDVMKPLASSPVFTDLIGKVSGVPVLGLLLGTVMTLVVQSSSATIAVLQNFAGQAGPDGVTSILGLAGAIPILLGDNIGTTITALLASLGQCRDARRTAVAHTIFNLSGSLVFIWFVKPYAALIQAISPKGPEVEVISRQIANAHTLFNLTMTIVWVCLLGVMVKIVMYLIPDAKDEEVNPLQPAFLDKKVISQPTVALKLVAKEVLHCSEIVRGMLKDLSELSKTEDTELVSKIKAQGQTIHSLQEAINDYLAELFSAGVLTELQATQTAKLMHVCGDVERMGELSVDLADVIAGKIQMEYSFSEEAMQDLEKSIGQIYKMYNDAMKALERGEPEKPEKLIRRREKVMDLDINMRKAHMDRVNKGKCKAKLSAPFTRLLHCVDRMGNSCVNLADMAMEHMNFGYFLDMDET